MSTTNGHRLSRVLVTGGAGFIGSHVCEQLQARGCQVQALDSLATGHRENVAADIPLHVVDIRSDAEVRALLREERFEAIVHCAAQTSVERSMLEPDFDREVNVSATRQLVAAARESGVRRFLFMSSGGAIYGETDEPATERTVPQPRSFYGVHKYVAEEFVRVGGLPFAILRPSNVYGPRQRSDAEGGVIAIFCERLAAGERLEVHGDGQQVRDFLFVGDVVSAVLLALDSPEDVIWNVSSGTASTVLETASLIGRALECTPQLDFRPRRAGDVRQSLVSPSRLLATGRWGPPRGLEDGLRQLTENALIASGG